MTKEELIKKFGLKPHIEGGYFKELDHSDIKYNNEQYLYSSIIFLLGDGDISHLHVLQEDELWYYQGGDDCTVIDIDENYNIKEVKVGINNEDAFPQYLVRKGHIFGSKYIGKTFTLVGCMVSPSFLYSHFKLIKREDLEEKLDKETLDQIDEMFAK